MGGWSQIRAEFQLLKVALPQQYDYYHYLQGSDFPIKSREDISEFFLRNAGKEFIEFSPKNYGFAHWKCDYQHILVDNPCYRSSMILKGISHTWVKIQILIRRHSMMDRPSEMLYHGSALWSITNDFARYVLSRERDIRKRYCHALAADEVFMQTLIMKSPYKDRIYHFEERDGNVRYIDWEHRKGSSPKTFTAKEYELLMSLPESFLFARKFSDESVDVVLQIAKAITR